MAQNNCPEWVRKEIPAELAIEYWCRRAFFEVIEELSDMIFWSWVIVSYTFWLYGLVDWLPIFVIGSVLVIIWPGRHFFFEMNRWRNEIHVVARHDEQAGGMYFKFSGGFSGWNRNQKKDPITDRSPSADVKKNSFYRIWGFLTGEQMVRYSLKSDNNQFIDGRKVSPQLDRAVDRVRFATPRKDIMDLPNALQWTREFTRLGALGIWNEEEMRHHIDTVVSQQFYGT
jgi:hypothetical protein